MKKIRLKAAALAATFALTALPGCSGEQPQSSNIGSSAPVTPPVSSENSSQPLPSEDSSADSEDSNSSDTDTSYDDTSSAPAPTDTESSEPPVQSAPETTPDITTTTQVTTPKPETTTTPAATTTTTTASATPTPAVPDKPYVVAPTAPGKTVYENDAAVIDASNASDGYLMIKLKDPDPKNEYKILIDFPGGSDTYIYVLNNKGNYETIPLTCSSGTYTVDILKLTKATKGTRVFRKDVPVTISDDFAPFLSPNQYCNYTSSSNCVSKASEICAGHDEIGKIEKIYKFVLGALEYKITSVNSASGYVPDPDRALRDGYGVCFDYATLMAAMLRSQKLPTKVVVGYAGSTYHAWISVYVKSVGWIDGIINFDGNKWKRMDPTYADSARDDEDYKYLINYIQNPSNYTDMFYY